MIRSAVLHPVVSGPDLAEHLGRVDRLLRDVLGELTRLWTTQLEDPLLGVDILREADLPQLAAQLSGAGGKRLRPAMAYLGWLAAGGRRREIGYPAVVRVGAALELLHLFALIHDDVMDESASRRGRPTVHTQASRQHRAAAGRGASARFGESIAILLGDLAHAEADHLVSDLPEPMRRLWRLLVVEMICGQRRDLTGSAAGRTDLANARQVARAKSGAYTVERPLQLGAAAASASAPVSERLTVYGRALGEAFALRDDLLGVWGDPVRTGKPIGDDLSAGKPTVLLALAKRRLGPAGRQLLERVVEGCGTPGEVAALVGELDRIGVRMEVEELIGIHVAVALDALDESVLDPHAIEQLTLMAHQVAWRDH